MSPKRKGEDSSGILPCLPRNPKDLRLLTLVPSLLAGSGIACRGCRSALRHAQVARSAALGDFVHHKLERRAAAPRVENDGLVDRAVLFLEAVVIRKNVDRVLVLLGIGVFQHQLNAAHFCRAALALYGEFKTIALASAAKLIDFVMVAGD